MRSLSQCAVLGRYQRIRPFKDQVPVARGSPGRKLRRLSQSAAAKKRCSSRARRRLVKIATKTPTRPNLRKAVRLRARIATIRSAGRPQLQSRHADTFSASGRHAKVACDMCHKQIVLVEGNPVILYKKVLTKCADATGQTFVHCNSGFRAASLSKITTNFASHGQVRDQD